MTDVKRTSGGRTLAGWAVLALPLILMLFLFVTPVIRMAVMSFTDLKASNIVTGSEFVGFKNFEELFNSPRFGQSLINTFLSPLLILRIILCAALPLSLAVLLMELRSGARIALQAIVAPVILFSGAVITSIYYHSYYGPEGPLMRAFLSAGVLARPTLGLAIGQEGSFFGNILTLLLTNGLALTLPLGLAVFFAAARGIRVMTLDTARLNREYISRIGRLSFAFLLCTIGVSFLNLENTFMIDNPLMLQENIINDSWKYAMRMLRFSYGSAMMMCLVVPLLIIGLGTILFLERKNTPLSIRFSPREKGKPAAGTGTRVAKIALLIGAGVGTLILIYVLVIAFLLPWLAGFAASFGPGSREALASLPQLVPALVISLATALVSALLCHLFTSAIGFSLGYLRPKGGKAVTVLLGLCLFLSPAVLILPYYFGFRELGALDSISSLIIPYLISPLGAILFTWFFRGARDECDWLSAQGLPLKRGAFPRRTVGGFLRFSLPVFAIYFIISLNSFLVPFTMVGQNQDIQPLGYHLYRMQSSFIKITTIIDGTGGYILPNGFKEAMAQVSLLQYLFPLALLIVSIIVVFPRLALIIRKKGEAAPALDPEDVEKLKG